MNKIVIVILVVIALVVLVFMGQGNQYKDFIKTATKTTGHIVTKEERVIDPATKQKEYWVTYTYTDQRGNIHSTQANLEFPDLWQHFREGQTEIVYYDKSNPSESYLAVVLDRKLGRK